ncbi:LysM peptidoglycan-binding domain-containing protein [Neobacillus sp. OS1-33]|uniref:LysM peptidoglycan-binding domain-containing protein n=1 Tax=Neobacillus sp. OS1-33 TaxID=3070683 RepID=UPI0027DF619F|nr:LysM peptidoglycan-binding domain-containing protein [Neobacillus sp. OS1-33]WML26769.1 LysM peptidoglycan-binding domain-containing protein [Neobacillus sp. OS1-33]
MQRLFGMGYGGYPGMGFGGYGIGYGGFPRMGFGDYRMGYGGFPRMDFGDNRVGYSGYRPMSRMIEVTSFNLSASTVAFQGNRVPGYTTIQLQTNVPTRGYLLLVGNGLQTKINLSTLAYKTVHKVDWVPWDDTKKAPLPAGIYQIKGYLTDQEYNQMQGYPLGQLTVVSESNPKPLIDGVSPNPAVFSPKYGLTQINSVQIPFNLNRPAEVQLTIRNMNGDEIYTGSKETLSPGSHTVSWNGTDKTGRIVMDGSYEIVFKTIETAYNYPSTTPLTWRSGTITIKDADYYIPVSRLKEIVTDASFQSPSFTPDGDGINDKVTGQFTLAVPARLSIYIANAAGAHAALVVSEQSFEAGTHTFEWNGSDIMGGKVPNGSYYIKLNVIEGPNSGYITFPSAVRVQNMYEIKPMQPEKRVRVISETAKMSVDPAGQGYTAIKGDTFPLMSEAIENGKYTVLVKEGVTGTISVSDVELVTEPSSTKPTTDYIVVSGDTLWKIASKFNTTSSEIVTLNNLDPSKYLYVGQKLKVPASSSQQPEQPAATIYSVVSGDTLWKIAQKFGVTAQAIVDANKLDPAAYLYIGQKLIIPGVVQPVLPAATSYSVVSGDTLWKIAQKFGVTAQAIVDANKLDPTAYLYIGQKLIIPGVAQPELPVTTTYSVVSGDTLWKIAQKFGVTAQAIVDANKLDPTAYLYIGQRLIIPSKQ